MEDPVYHGQDCDSIWRENISSKSRASSIVICIVYACSILKRSVEQKCCPCNHHSFDAVTFPRVICHLTDDPVESFCHLDIRKFGLDSFFARVAHIAKLLVGQLVQDFVHDCSPGPDIIWWTVPASRSIYNCLKWATSIGCQDRNPSQHCLERDYAEMFIRWCIDK